MTALKQSDQNDKVIAIVNLETGEIEATSVFRVNPERLFLALTTPEICDWWVRPGVFNTQEWNGDLKKGGRWSASGIGGGQPYQLEGEFIEVVPPHKLSHTWRAVGSPGGTAFVTYHLTSHAYGVLLTLRHTGILNPEICEKTRAGWETSLSRLQEIIATEKGPPPT